MNFEWYLAKRYFKGKRKGSSFLSFIKVMAITGVAVGSAGLLIALSVVHGFKSVIDNKVLGFAPHLTITTFSESPIPRADTLVKDIRSYPQVDVAQPVVTGQTMVQSSSDITGTLFKGVDESGDVTDIRSYVNRGKYDLSTDSSGLPGMVLGADLARTLNADINSTITTYTVDGIPSPFNSPDIQQFRLAGIYETGISQFDNILALVARPYAQNLFDFTESSASAIEVRLKDPDQIRSFDEQLGAELQYPYFSETIYDKYSSIFAWVDLQEETIPFVIGVMIIVAAFNLIGTVLMMVLERTRDIGILKTMGAADKSVRKIFMIEGLFVAITGLAIGIILSLVFAWLQSTYHLIPLSEENYYMAYAPVEPHMLDFFIVTIVTLLLCSLASWLPARIASNTDPLKVIAYGR